MRNLKIKLALKGCCEIVHLRWAREANETRKLAFEFFSWLWALEKDLEEPSPFSHPHTKQPSSR